MRTRPTVSVIVPTYDRREMLPRVLAPLLADRATLEVVVVVDGCRDGSLELLRDLSRAEPRVRPLFIENRGLAGAQQAGVERANGDVVLMIDDDVIAAPDLVSGHARRHAGQEGLVVVGYMPIAEQATRGAGSLTSRLYAREYEFSCSMYEADPGTILRFLWGGNVSLRLADCRRVPVFSPRFPARYHMDRDFGLRCLEAGLEGVFDRTLLAEHAHRRSLDGMLREARHAGAGRALVQRLHADAVGPPDPGAFTEGLPAPARWVVRAARRPVGRDLVSALLRPLLRSAGVLRVRAVELRTAQLLRRVELQHGALTYLHRGETP